MLEQRKLEVRGDQLETSKDVGERCRRRWRRERDRNARRVLIIARRQQRDRAFVIRRAGRRMDLFVQLGDCGKNDREKDCTDASRGEDRTQSGGFAISEAEVHFVGESASGAGLAQARSLDTAAGMAYPSDMIGPAKIYFIIFGLLTIVGGVIGYVKAGSTASIIAGGISGIALIAAAFLLPGNPPLGLIIAGLISIALAARFIPAFMKTGKVMPAGLMAVLSAIGVVMAIVAWIKK